MNVTLLESPPISGTVDEKSFEVVGEATWVLFELDDGSSWAGAFGDGGRFTGDFSRTLALDPHTAAVIARGRFYLLDAVDRRLIHVDRHDAWTAMCGVPERGLVVLADFDRLLALNRSGELWHSDRIALDGIILDAATSDELVGKLWWWDGWYAFTLRFDGWVFQQGERLTTEWSAFPDPSA